MKLLSRNLLGTKTKAQNDESNYESHRFRNKKSTHFIEAVFAQTHLRKSGDWRTKGGGKRVKTWRRGKEGGQEGKGGKESNLQCSKKRELIKKL